MNYLRFRLQGLSYGLPLDIVKEVFFLPELTPLPEAPADIIGVLNLRGTLLPVMHLGKRLGLANPICLTTDIVITLEWQGLRVGVIVDTVEEVITLDPQQINPEPDYGRLNPLATAFMDGIAQVGENLILLVNPDTLIRSPEDVANLTDVDMETLVIPEDFYQLYAADMDTQGRSLLQQRKVDFAQTEKNSQEVEDPLILAIVKLEHERIGISLEYIREFVDISHYVPVPCCPEHIVGNMNLRGEIMTLIDIRPTLNLAQSAQHLRKAVVIEVDDISAAVLVEDVEDVLKVTYSDLRLSPFFGENHHRLGTVMQGDQIVTLLNTRQLLQGNSLMVEAA
ncbi:chemotaxis protein CheW [Candidatus Synechococcus calcipolaris G9]|uniref:Chemotaxis protein CheW n=1 Tax=Candidatus Synechococcus calcipolaris G9 TaxID=1497997 RepID=A0ABT6EZH6_9SYNE|nr:chemotaxis protein CheW [Candidatus Synechococcus calcipolaris]MDG2990999.1 chemotaxis protein CheW [Candidatus Synechococcus calcipolaris G9]